MTTEALEGMEREILIPLLIDNVKPPLGYRIAQTAKMTEWPGRSGQLVPIRKLRFRLSQDDREVASYRLIQAGSMAAKNAIILIGF